MIQQNKSFFRRYVEEIYNKKRVESYHEFVGGELYSQGLDHLKQLFEAFPDSQTTVLDLIAEGDKIVAYMEVVGTHKGPFAGQPETGRKIKFHTMRIFEIVENKIIASWAVQDRLSLMEQLGLVQSVGDVNWASGDED